jgi:diadenosine tetraphosphate (Ap4A) HIT family hydrolase
VVAKTHVVEPFELAEPERSLFWSELLIVAEAVARASSAVKLNYEVHGNTIPHLHVHIFPRFSGDPFEGRPIDPHAATPFNRSSDDLQRLKRAIDDAIQRAE